MFKTLNARSLKERLNERPRILITMHRGPDGDAIGSSLGFAHFLKKLGITSKVVAPDEYPNFLKWLPGTEEVIIYENDHEKADQAVSDSDLIFCLDFNHPDRLSHFKESVIRSGKPILVIDHHRDPDPFADEYYIDSNASSTAELVYRLVAEMKETALLDKNSALCLYTGLVTDTGSFRFSSVTPGVLRIASDLLERGVDHTVIYDKIYDNSTLDRLRLKGYALYEKTVLIENTGAAYIYLSERDLDRFNYHRGDTEGLVNYALSLEGVNVAGFFYERDGYIKISLRSKGDIDVNLIASTYFLGGGHKNAAGGRSNDSLEETIAQFVRVAKSGFKITSVDE